MGPRGIGASPLAVERLRAEVRILVYMIRCGLQQLVVHPKEHSSFERMSTRHLKILLGSAREIYAGVSLLPVSQEVGTRIA